MQAPKSQISSGRYEWDFTSEHTTTAFSSWSLRKLHRRLLLWPLYALWIFTLACAARTAYFRIRLSGNTSALLSLLFCITLQAGNTPPHNLMRPHSLYSCRKHALALHFHMISFAANTPPDQPVMRVWPEFLIGTVT